MPQTQALDEVWFLGPVPEVGSSPGDPRVAGRPYGALEAVYDLGPVEPDGLEIILSMGAGVDHWITTVDHVGGRWHQSATSEVPAL